MSRSNVRIASAQRRVNIRNEIMRGASELGIDPMDLATVISYETGGTILSGKYRHGLDNYGGAGGVHLGWIQFSPDRQRQYNVKPGMNSRQMMDAVISYLRDEGVRPGDNITTIYQAIQGPKYVEEARRTGKAVGRDENGTVQGHLNKMDPHRPNAEKLLRGY